MVQAIKVVKLIDAVTDCVPIVSSLKRRHSHLPNVVSMSYLIEKDVNDYCFYRKESCLTNIKEILNDTRLPFKAILLNRLLELAFSIVQI